MSAVTAANPTTDWAWRSLVESASGRFRPVGRFAWHFARGKLVLDPVFRSLLEAGALGQSKRVVDIGCGQGLMASLLQSCNDLRQQDRWPRAWPNPPAASSYTGIELMQRDVDRAERALAGSGLAPRFVCGDMRDAPLPACDLVVILDVLHYVDHSAQQALLARVRGALQPRGRLLLRVGDASRSRGYGISQWVDRVVTRVRGHRVAPTWGRTLEQWCGLLASSGFGVRSVPMSAGTPFANVLLIADCQEALK